MRSNYSWEKPIGKSLWISSMLLDSNSTMLFITNKVSLFSVPTFLISNKSRKNKLVLKKKKKKVDSVS